MNYKMVCIDMDGTLLSKRKTISDESKRVIKEINDKGIKVVVTTGRLYNNAAYYSKLIGASDSVIAGNGAIIRNKNSDEIIFKKDIDINICKKLILIAQKCGIILHIHTINEILTNSYFSNIIARIVLPGIKDSDFPIKITTIKSEDNWNNKLKNYKGKIIKCITFSTSAKKTEMFRKELDNIKEVVYYCSGDRSIEINNKEVSKGNGVKALADYYGISREEIICIGDNENDVSMIEYAGLGIAMGNGIEELKEKADYITDTNNNDGVKKALEKFILKVR
mgnify:CR=1 FL=1